MLYRSATPRHTGFALIEMLVVVVIVGLLLVTVYSYFFQSFQKAQYAEAQQELEQIRQAVEVMHADTGWYPARNNGTRSICESTGTNEIMASDPNAGLVDNGLGWPRWKGPYLDGADVVDPWGTPYYFDHDFRCEDKVVGCHGRDGGPLTSVIVSCGPNQLLEFWDGSAGAAVTCTPDENCETRPLHTPIGCAYDDDNVVILFCERA